MKILLFLRQGTLYLSLKQSYFYTLEGDGIWVRK